MSGPIGVMRPVVGIARGRGKTSPPADYYYEVSTIDKVELTKFYPTGKYETLPLLSGVRFEENKEEAKCLKIESIAPGAFAGIVSLVYIDFGALPLLGSISGEAVSACPFLESVVIGDNVVVSGWAILGNVRLKILKIGNSCKLDRASVDGSMFGSVTIGEACLLEIGCLEDETYNLLEVYDSGTTTTYVLDDGKWIAPKGGK